MSSSPCLRSQRRWPLLWAAAKHLEIFTGWCRMFGSMCLLMVTNVIFFKMLLSVLATVPQRFRCSPVHRADPYDCQGRTESRRHCNTHRLKSRYHRRLSGKRTPRHADLYGGSQCGFSNYKGSGQVRRKRRQRRCAQRAVRRPAWAGPAEVMATRRSMSGKAQRKAAQIKAHHRNRLMRKAPLYIQARRNHPRRKSRPYLLRRTVCLKIRQRQGPRRNGKVLFLSAHAALRHIKAATKIPPVGAQNASGRPGTAGKSWRFGTPRCGGSGRDSSKRRALPSLAAHESTFARATQPGRAGTPAAPSASRMSQINAQKVQGGATGQVTQAAEHTGITVGQTTVNTLQDNSPRPAAGIVVRCLPPPLFAAEYRPCSNIHPMRAIRSGPQAANRSGIAASGGKVRTPAPQECKAPFLRSGRLENRDPAGMVFQAARQFLRMHGSIVRFGRNRAVLPQPPRRHSKGQRLTDTPTRQERRQASHRHHSRGRQSDRPHLLRKQRAAGKKAVSTTAALKGSVKADGDVKPSRKQRGKKHG